MYGYSSPQANQAAASSQAAAPTDKYYTIDLNGNPLIMGAPGSQQAVSPTPAAPSAGAPTTAPAQSTTTPPTAFSPNPWGSTPVPEQNFVTPQVAPDDPRLAIGMAMRPTGTRTQGGGWRMSPEALQRLSSYHPPAPNFSNPFGQPLRRPPVG